MADATVYRLYDRDGALLYVGVTARSTARLGQHMDDKDWWWLVASAQFEHFPTRADAQAREASLIRTEMPRHNRRSGASPDLSDGVRFTLRCPLDLYEYLLKRAGGEKWRIPDVVAQTIHEELALRGLTPDAGE